MQQSEFALGYYQQRAALYAPKPTKDTSDDSESEDTVND